MSWPRRDVELMLALGEVEAQEKRDTDPISGLPWDVVTDPANQFRFKTRYPKTNWYARTLAADQRAYYKPLDEAAKKADQPPVLREGHMWSAYLDETIPVIGGD